MNQEERSSGHPGQKTVAVGQTPDGRHILSLLVKRTYHVERGEKCKRATEDREIYKSDVFYDQPNSSSIEFESDIVAFKTLTDVVINGFAYAPPGSPPVNSLVVSVEVGQYWKDVLVIGDRYCQFLHRRHPTFTAAEPFERIPLCYERAYGGIDFRSDPSVPSAYPRNPVGTGYAILKDWHVIHDLRLPNLENLEDRLTPSRLCVCEPGLWEQQPTPEGFGWLGKSWSPRSSFAGVLPADRIQREDSEAETVSLPDINFYFFNGASPGLALPFLAGDERIRLVHLDPVGDLWFDLPADLPVLAVDIGAGPTEPEEVVLQTLMIRAEDRQVDLVWRGAIEYPGPDSIADIHKLDLLVE